MITRRPSHTCAMPNKISWRGVVLVPFVAIHDHQTGWQDGVDVFGLGVCVVRHRLQDDDPGVYQGDAGMGQAADRGERRLWLEAAAGIDDDVGVVALGGARE